MSRVLFVCIHNAGRSQMAAALLELVAGGRHEARSAGSDPGEHVHPEVVEVMRELGIDLADRVPHLLDRADAEWADVVVTMGCGDACPYIPGKRYVDWDLPDPKGLPLEEVRAIRDDIRGRIERLVAELDLAATIRTARLDLVLLDRAWLQAYADGKPLPDLGFADPDGFLAGSAELVRWRLAQIAADPSEEPWLLRAIVDRAEAVAVGYVNFHAPPDERGMVEIGYTIVPSRRRQGYASEAAEGMWGWAAEHGARVLRAVDQPRQRAVARAHPQGGLRRGRSQIDEIDGLELIFESLPRPERKRADGPCRRSLSGRSGLPRRYGDRMARRNRVTPFSELVADEARGLVYGNRGCLHNADGEITRRFGVKRWISCRLEFRAGSGHVCCSRAGSRSCSSSTRRRRSPRAIVPARFAATRTTETL